MSQKRLESLQFTRCLDKLGRVVIPMEYRRAMRLSVGAPISITSKNGAIVLRPAFTGCVFCGDPEHLRTFKDQPVCQSCCEEMGQGELPNWLDEEEIEEVSDDEINPK